MAGFRCSSTVEARLVHPLTAKVFKMKEKPEQPRDAIAYKLVSTNKPKVYFIKTHWRKGAGHRGMG